MRNSARTTRRRFVQFTRNITRSCWESRTNSPRSTTASARTICRTFWASRLRTATTTASTPTARRICSYSTSWKRRVRRGRSVRARILYRRRGAVLDLRVDGARRIGESRQVRKRHPALQRHTGIHGVRAVFLRRSVVHTVAAERLRRRTARPLLTELLRGKTGTGIKRPQKTKDPMGNHRVFFAHCRRRGIHGKYTKYYCMQRRNVVYYF